MQFKTAIGNNPNQNAPRSMVKRQGVWSVFAVEPSRKSFSMGAFHTTSVKSQISGFRHRLAEGLWRAATVFLATMPIGMAIAHRSSPLFLALSTLCSLGAVIAEEKVRPFLRHAFSTLMAPLGLAVLTFFGWGLISIGWSEFKATSLWAFGEFWLCVALAFVLGLTLGQRITRPAFWLLTCIFVVACGLIAFELATGLAFRRSLGAQAYGFVFNRSVLTLLVLSLPLMAWFLGHVRYGWAWSFGLALLLSATVLVSESQAALFGLIIAGLALSVAWFAPRLAWAAAAAAFVITLFIAPLIGPIGTYLIPASMHETMAAGHTRERIALWTSFGVVVREQPFLGAGFGVSPRMSEAAVATKLPGDERKMLSIGHPHNFALQIWTELGAIGITIALGIIILTLRAVVGQPHLIRISALALIAGAGAVAAVGHGAWQGWWGASLGAAVIWTRATNGTQPGTRA